MEIAGGSGRGGRAGPPRGGLRGLVAPRGRSRPEGVGRRDLRERVRGRRPGGANLAPPCRSRPRAIRRRGCCPMPTGRTATGSTSRRGPSAACIGSPSGRGARSGFPRAISALWLDPGMAFGTGNHETTRLCIERLVEFEAGLPAARPRRRTCGSSMPAAARESSRCQPASSGFGDVSGFDIDPEAVRVSIENARAQRAFRPGSGSAAAGLAGGLEGAGAGVVLANIQADILIRHAGLLAAPSRPAGLLAMSGILAAEGAWRQGRLCPGRPAAGASTPGSLANGATFACAARLPRALRRTAPAWSGVRNSSM